MPDLLLTNLEPALLDRLEKSALKHGRSVEEEAIELIRLELARQSCLPSRNIADIARELFGPEHGFELDLPPRGSAPSRPPPEFC